MSKKIKGVVSDLTTPYGVGLYEDDRARMKHQSLMQDYQELQKEVDIMRSRSEAGKQRRTILTAQVRFLRKRFEYLAKSKTMNSSLKEKLVKQKKPAKELSRKEASFRMLPPIPEARAKKRKYISKDVVTRGTFPESQHQRKMYSLAKVSELSHKGRVGTRKNNLAWNTAPVVDLSKQERMLANDTAIAFDLNQDDSSSGKESPMPSRAPTFDLNEVSLWD